MPLVPLHIGYEETLEAFNDLYTEGCAYAVLNAQPTILFQYTGEDIEAGKHLFERMMKKYEESGNTSIFFIKVYPMPKEGKFLEPRGKCLSTTPVRLNDLISMEIEPVLPGDPRPYRNNNQGGDYRMFEAIEVVKNLPAQINEKIDIKFNEFEARLKAIEEAEPEEEESTTIGQIGRLMENPQIAQAIPGLISSVIELINRFIPPKLNTIMSAPKAVSGTDELPAPPQTEQTPVDVDLMNAAVNRLHAFCRVDTDLNLLADFAETQPAMFEMLLMQLRSQKKAQ